MQEYPQYLLVAGLDFPELRSKEYGRRAGFRQNLARLRQIEAHVESKNWQKE